MEKKVPSSHRNEENASASENNIPSLREGNLDSFPESANHFGETFDYKKEDNVKGVKEENERAIPEKSSSHDDQKGGNVLSKSLNGVPGKVIMTLAGAVTAVVAVVGIASVTPTAPSISGTCVFLNEALSCHLALTNPSAIDLSFSIAGRSNGFSYSESIASSSVSPSPKKEASGESSSSSSEETPVIVSFDREIHVPDYSNYDVYVKGDIGYGEKTYYHAAVSQQADGVSVLGEPFYNDYGSLEIDLSIENPNDYALTLNIKDAANDAVLYADIPVTGSDYRSSFDVASGIPAKISVTASKGYSSREVYFRSLEAQRYNPYDLVTEFFDGYLVYGVSLKTGGTALAKCRLDVAGVDDDYSYSLSLENKDNYRDTLTLDANKRYTVALFDALGSQERLLLRSAPLSSGSLLEGPSMKGYNSTLFFSYTSLAKWSYGSYYLDVFDEGRASLLDSFTLVESSCYIVKAAGPYSYDIAADFPNGDGSVSSKVIYASTITTDTLEEPRISSDARAADDVLYYSLSAAYSGNGTKLSASYALNVYGSSVKETLLGSADLGTDPSLWTASTLKLTASSSYYYEVVATSSYGSEIYFSATLTNESNVLPIIYGSVNLDGSALVVDLTSNGGTLGSTLSISNNNGVSLYSEAFTGSYSDKLSVTTSEGPFTVSLLSDSIDGNQMDLFSASVAARDDLGFSLSPGLYEIPDKTLSYAFHFYPSSASEELTVTSKGRTSGTIQTQSFSTVYPPTSFEIDSGSFNMNSEDQEVSLKDASGNLIYYGIIKYKDSVARPTATGASATLTDQSTRNINVNIPTIVNPDGLPLEVATIPYDSSGNEMSDYDQASSVAGNETSYSNTDTMVDTTIAASYAIVKLRLRQGLGEEVYWQSDQLAFT